MARAEADYDWDISISYAHDDKPKGATSNWIEKFKQQLEFQIKTLSGSKYDRIYYQQTQTYNARIKSILQKVGGSEACSSSARRIGSTAGGARTRPRPLSGTTGAPPRSSSPK